MCFSPLISASLGTAGVATAAYTHKRGDPLPITLLVLYFSLMEFLQLAGYYVVNQCGTDGNNIITLLSWIHIAFQPLVFNYYLLWRIGVKSLLAKRIAYGASAAFAAIAIIKIIPFEPRSLCSLGDTLCGPIMCTLSGSWHIAWSMPQYYSPIPFDTFIYYAIAVFIVPFFYGARRDALLMFLSGPAFAYFISGGNPLEWPAIWCLYSVALLFYVLSVIHGQRGSPLFRIPKRNK